MSSGWLSLGSGSAESNAAKYIGVSPPISVEQPSETDRHNSTTLLSILQEQGLIESRDDAAKREAVLGKLNLIIERWGRKTTVDLGLGSQMANECRLHLCTFGSFRLGVHVSGADIDTLVVGPRHLTRELVFVSLVDELRADSRCVDITAVLDAYVPVIKFTFDGIDIDLLYAQLALDTLPEQLNLFDNALLHNIDDQSIRSLNGVRVTDMILSLVPNKPSFRVALRFIKHWAKERGVYSNVFGFLGGVSWAILTARVCQLFPNASASLLVQKFFTVFHLWKWPTPVVLCEIADDPLGLPVWNPAINPRERLDLLPVITPAYPSMNSTYNVSPATMRLLKKELKRGKELTETLGHEIFSVDDYKRLFAHTDIFLEHSHFLQVNALSPTKDQLHKWLGWIEAKMRILIKNVENTPNCSAFPFPKHYPLENRTVIVERTVPKESGEGDETKQVEEEAVGECFFIGLDFEVPSGSGRSVDLTSAVQYFIYVVNEYAFREPGMCVELLHRRATTLPEHVFHDHRRPSKKKKRKKVNKLVQEVPKRQALEEEQPAVVADAATPPAAAAAVDADATPNVLESTVSTKISTPTPSETENSIAVEAKVDDAQPALLDDDEDDAPELTSLATVSTEISSTSIST